MTDLDRAYDEVSAASIIAAHSLGAAVPRTETDARIADLELRMRELERQIAIYLNKADT